VTVLLAYSAALLPSTRGSDNTRAVALSTPLFTEKHVSVLSAAFPMFVPSLSWQNDHF
jgi:hypothetical protein